MCRHCEAREELFERIKDGEIGDIIAAAGLPPDRPGRLGLRPAQARRHQRADVPDPAVPRLPLGQRRLLQRLPDPQHRRVLLDEGRLAGQGHRPPAAGTTAATTSTRTSTPTRSSTPSPTAPSCSSKAATCAGCHQEFASYAHGTKGSAVISTERRTRPAKCRIYKGQKHRPSDDLVWAFPQPEPNPYQLEWDDLIDAIRNDKPYNEVKRGAEASLVTSMGRMAAHTGQVITFDDMLNCEHEFAPDVDKLAMDGPAPLAGRLVDGPLPLPAAGHPQRPRVTNGPRETARPNRYQSKGAGTGGTLVSASLFLGGTGLPRRRNHRDRQAVRSSRFWLSVVL